MFAAGTLYSAMWISGVLRMGSVPRPQEGSTANRIHLHHGMCRPLLPVEETFRPPCLTCDRKTK